ncbi:MAG: hypothetical protein CVU91_05715 [Firmicutes bacterium HGW-Firmicutes-16]|nr:MAG: hypothetical protein CVU91_05715 [Firmicutes bacterium HGW-Firmicutes-16]
MLPSTTKKVPYSTNKDVNTRIRENCLYELTGSDLKDDQALTERIKKLNREWDTERFLETNASLIIFIGSLIGLLTMNFYWFLLPGFISFFLLQHALQGWCPPLPLIRRAGIRTAEEISNEKVVLKHLRGDFKQQFEDAGEILRNAEK